MTLEKSLQGYIAAAHEHGAETDLCESARKINRAYGKVKKNYLALIQSEEGKAALREQLASPDDYVRTWTAMLLIFDEPKVCERILREQLEKKGLWKSSVKTFLAEWKEGHIDSVF